MPGLAWITMEGKPLTNRLESRGHLHKIQPSPSFIALSLTKNDRDPIHNLNRNIGPIWIRLSNGRSPCNSSGILPCRIVSSCDVESG